MKVELYHRAICPFSAKVRRYIEDNDLKAWISYHDVDLEPTSRAQLRKLASREQVPCLVINGEPLLESDAILSWLDFNMVKRDPSAA